MARCGCGSVCSCALVDGDNTTVRGNGTTGQPYAVDVDLPDLSQYIAVSGTPTNGQGLVYSTTLGKFVPANIPGAAQLAQAKNVTGVITVASAAAGLGAAVDVPGTAITVPNSSGKNVVLRAQAVAYQSVIGLGEAYLTVIETTSGSASIGGDVKSLPNSINAAQYIFKMLGFIDIGVVTTNRTFKLQWQLYSPASNSPTANLLNGTQVSGNYSALTAVAQ